MQVKLIIRKLKLLNIQPASALKTTLEVLLKQSATLNYGLASLLFALMIRTLLCKVEILIKGNNCCRFQFSTVRLEVQQVRCMVLRTPNVNC
jgi:hypothetical protein